MKICVYTAIAGAFDRLREPRVITHGIDFIAFTDSDRVTSKGWQVRPMKDRERTPRRTARRYKLLPHEYLPEYDVWLWLDGCYDIRKELGGLIRQWLPGPAVTLRQHPWRRPLCVYAEAEACIKAEKGEPAEIRAQMKRYRLDGYPENNGMVVTGVLLRRNCAVVRDFNEGWHDQVMQGSDRDQLSFNYTAWKLGVPYRAIKPPDATSDQKPHVIWMDHHGPR